jgi:hypothetical protein
MLTTLAPAGFWHDPLTLIVVDKAVLASVLVAVGYFANRKLELFKSAQGLRAKIAELQVPKIAEAMERFAQINRRIQTFTLTTYKDSLEQWQQFRELEVRLMSETNEEAIRLMAVQKAWLPSTWDAALVKQYQLRADEVTALRAQITADRLELIQHQFWLGSVMYDVLLRRYEHIEQALGNTRALEHLYPAEVEPAYLDRSDFISRLRTRTWRLRRRVTAWQANRRDTRMLRQLGMELLHGGSTDAQRSVAAVAFPSVNT